jgi:hypothetical protein
MPIDVFAKIVSGSHLINTAPMMREAALLTPNRPQKGEKRQVAVLRKAPNTLGRALYVGEQEGYGICGRARHNPMILLDFP